MCVPWTGGEHAVDVGIDVVEMAADHLDVVVALEASSHTRPWSRSVFEEELQRRHDRAYLVALEDGEVVGYAGVQLLGEDAHITNVAVRPDRRRRGIASRLVIELIAEARRREATAATLEVRTSNGAARALYRRLGFAPVGVRRRYYEDPAEDALIMWLHDLDSIDRS